MTRAIVVGAGVFGLTAALELRARGLHVLVLDPGPVPHPLAESTDISKVVRIDYGSDADYTALGEEALAGWRRWNAEWPVPRFHETGVTFLSRAPMQPGGFEHDSYHLLVGRGHPLERLDTRAITARFPAYAPGVHVDGYYSPIGGWAESGAVVAQLATLAIAAGVEVRPHGVSQLADDGVITAHGHVAGDLVVVCAGAWVPRLVPELADSVRAIGQPVFHLRPRDPSLFEAARFPVFGADISRTGYYGFPVNTDGIVKIANHGTGIAIDRDEQRVVHPGHEAALRMFLREAFPALVDAPIVEGRLCVYGDTRDEHFWIARHPTRPRLVVATGGSGHAFKFAPALGPLIADIALGVPHPLAHKFRWRPELAERSGGDAARHRA
ncbi:MAG: FAD-dependent oxidoreductase [Kofleriaceae bacterium]|nr:FAD-dependent oxidoreductase [Kofleriaceae bacterium]